MELNRNQQIHFIGIGGISMSALAHALAVQGYRVSGSDRDDSPRLEVLRQAGITVAVGHAAANLPAAGLVVRTTAIPESNPELVTARAAGLAIHHRSEVLAWMLRGKQALAIAGTHGKTTTSAMAGTILEAAGLDPTVFVGGDVLQWGSNYRVGNGPQVVLEADESDGSFRAYPGCSEVITNIEADHLDQHGSVERVEEVFSEFLAQADPQGFVVYGADCPRLSRVIVHAPARMISFGLGEGADYQATDLRYVGTCSTFRLWCGGADGGEFTLQVPGEHNVRNALAALAAVEALGVSRECCRQALMAFRSTGRRFECLGRTDELAVYDDYAHHPTEVRATLAAARHMPWQRCIAIFQPHLYSRTRDFMDDFAAAFGEADVVVIADIYAAREEPVPGVSAAELAARVRLCRPGQEVLYRPDRAELITTVAGLARPGDLILTLGAGDIRQAGEELARRLTGSTSHGGAT